jgi:LysM repeat protein
VRIFKLVSFSFLAFFILINSPALIQAQSHETSITGKVNYSIRSAVLDEENGYIYAIASNYMKNPERLLFIDQHDLTVKADIQVRHAAEVEFTNGKVYVITRNDREITVVDIKTMSVEKKISTPVAPDHIEVHGDKLFYVDNTNYLYLARGVYVVNLINGKQETINTVDYEFSQADIEVDPIRNILYIAEMHDRSRDKFPRIQAISTIDYEVLDRYYNPNKEFFKNTYHIIADGNDVFYAGYRFNANNLNTIYGSYANKDIRYVKGDTVFAGMEAYDRTTFKKIKNIDKPFDFIDSQNNAYTISGVDGVTYIEKWPISIEKLADAYSVQRGDSLWKISQRFGTSVYALATLNALDPSKPILIGQTLKIPYVKEILEPSKPISVHHLPVHKAAPNETLSDIAQQYNLTVEELRAVNYIHNNELSVGLGLNIPIYKVKEGDTAWKIASGMGMTLNELVQLNDLKDPNYIMIGQILKVKVHEILP